MRPNISLDMLKGMETADAAQLPVGVLKDLLDEYILRADELKEIKIALDAALEEGFVSQARDALLADRKDTGTAVLNVGEYNVTVTLPKRVKWDQEVLIDALYKMNTDDARHYVNSTHKIDERKYDSAPDDIKALLLPARTVEVGKPSIKIEERT